MHSREWCWRRRLWGVLVISVDFQSVLLEYKEKIDYNMYVRNWQIAQAFPIQLIFIYLYNTVFPENSNPIIQYRHYTHKIYIRKCLNNSLSHHLEKYNFILKILKIKTTFEDCTLAMTRIQSSSTRIIA